MPLQEVFFEQQIGERRIAVLKTYDPVCARETFAAMDEIACAFLWKSLQIDESYEPADLPPADSEDGKQLLWDSLLEDSREDGNLMSFFLVTEVEGTSSRSLYVSPDWPSAEQYAQIALSAG